MHRMFDNSLIHHYPSSRRKIVFTPFRYQSAPVQSFEPGEDWRYRYVDETRFMSEHQLKAVAFPTLDEAQMAALGRCPLTRLKRYRDEEKLFEACERDFKFFVVKSDRDHG
jgi:hypothetical protein